MLGFKKNNFNKPPQQSYESFVSGMSHMQVWVIGEHTGWFLMSQ